MAAGNIKIGPKFFHNELREYSDWRWGIIREFFQNGIDAPGTSTINVEINRSEDDTLLVVVNNGKPMNQDTMTNKLLSLGETGKNFAEGSVGGFGKAKVLLYLAHESYKITTGDLMVVGCGGEYELVADQPFLHGTRSEVVIQGNQTQYLQEAVRKFAAYAQWDGTIFLNGEQLECNLKKGSPRREFEWGTVYTNKAIPHRVIVRVGGIPMFSHRTDLDRTVIVELKGPSVDVLTSNRDGLVWRFEAEFDQFLMDLVMNKSRALKAQNPTYTQWSGIRFRAITDEVVKEITGFGHTVVGEVAAKVSGITLNNERIGVLENVSAIDDDFIPEPAPTSQVSEFFVLKNELNLKIPEYYQPGSRTFGTYSKKLARVWGRLVLELHRMFKIDREFGIGFVFSEEAEAQHSKCSDYGTVYYINPAVVNADSKSMKKRFKLTERDRLLAIAVHEVVHGMGYSGHGEEYAAVLTEVFGKVMKERKRFNWAFN